MCVCVSAYIYIYMYVYIGGTVFIFVSGRTS